MALDVHCIMPDVPNYMSQKKDKNTTSNHCSHH